MASFGQAIGKLLPAPKTRYRCKKGRRLAPAAKGTTETCVSRVSTVSSR